MLVEYLKTRSLPEIARRLGIYPIITGRAKSLESFAEKIQRPTKKYLYDPLVEATDLAGVRVITFLQAEAADFIDESRRQFVIEREHSKDKSSALAVQEFGYLSIHLIIQLRETPRPEDFLHLPGLEISDEQLGRLPNLKCELQVRTLCQHAWAGVFHELGYKNEFQLPRLWQREFAKVAAMLEVCDRQFMDIKNSLAAYESGYGAYMDKGQLKDLANRLEVLLEVDTGNVKILHRLLRTYIGLGKPDQRFRGLLKKQRRVAG